MSEFMSVYFIPTLLGLFVNALTSLVSNNLPSPKEDPKLAKTITSIIDDLFQTYEWNGFIKIEEIGIFLSTPEVQQIVEQLFSINSLENNSNKDDVEAEFILHFRNFFVEVRDEDLENAKRLFSVIQNSALKILEIKVGEKGFKELLALINYQFKHLEKSIEGLKENLKFLRNSNKIDVKAILDFEKQYRSQVAQRLKHISLYNLDVSRRVNVSDIYVSPLIRRTTRSYSSLWKTSKIEYRVPIKDLFIDNKLRSSTTYKSTLDSYLSNNFLFPVNSERMLNLESEALYHSLLSSSFQPESKDSLVELTNEFEFYSLIDKTVVLGNPGGGKSTLTYKLCSDLDEFYEKRLINNKKLTPIHITVRDFGESKNKNNWSILQFIESVSNSHYQLKVPTEAFQYLLHNSRAILIFDGLDELLDTSYRKEIVNDIESFCALYPNTPVLVTSREVGYEQAPLNTSIFNAFVLSSFNDDQVGKYAEKWFKLEQDLSREQQNYKAATFLKESEIASDIRSNPLMLGLMCSIYRGENYIPQNRPDLYEKCSVMLFEKWDKSRGINPNIGFEAHLRPGMMYLAYWIYTSENLQGGVKESILVEKTTDYLEDFYKSRNEAEFTAKEFVDFCKGRAWVFTDVGDGIYKFTHQTFLEYFTACFLNRKLRSPIELYNELIKKIRKAEWDVVAQLSIQILDRKLEGGADEFINLLLSDFENDQKNDIKEKFIILSFITRCTKFIVPTYGTKRKIVTTLMTFLINSVSQNLNSSNSIFELWNLLNYLVKTTSENKESFITIICDYLIDKLASPNSKEIEIILRLSYYFQNQLGSKLKQTVIETVRNLTDNKINALLKYHFELISEDELLERFGIETLFYRSYIFQFLPAFFNLPSLFDLIMRYLSMDELDEKQIGKAKQLLISIGNYFIKSDLKETQLFSNLIPKNAKIPAQTVNPETNEMFGAFIIFACLIEKSSHTQKFIRRNSFSINLLGKKLNYSFTGRMKTNPNLVQINCELRDINIDVEQKEIIRKWSRKEISFLQKLKR